MDEKDIEIIEETEKIKETESETEAERIASEEVEAETQVKEMETFKEMSPVRLVLRRFFRSKLSIVGIVMLVFLFAFSFLGPVIYTKWEETVPD